MIFVSPYDNNNEISRYMYSIYNMDINVFHGMCSNTFMIQCVSISLQMILYFLIFSYILYFLAFSATFAEYGIRYGTQYARRN